MGALFGEALVLSDAAQCPEAGAFQGFFLVGAGVIEGGQLVEGEHDVRTDLMLYLHGNFGGKAVYIAVDMGLEEDPVIVHVRHALLAGGNVIVAQGAAIRANGVSNGAHVNDLLEARTQAHHLKTSGVGEGRAIPVHELTQAACGVQHIGAGLQVEVVGVREQGLGTQVFHSFG